jgi:hypothetical protein
MPKKKNYPYRYEMMIGERHRGKMEPSLIRWCIEHKELVRQLKIDYSKEMINNLILTT